MTLPQAVLQCIKKSSKGVHRGAKTYWISPASLWNSTTITTLLYNYTMKNFWWVLYSIHKKFFKKFWKSQYFSLSLLVLNFEVGSDFNLPKWKLPFKSVVSATMAMVCSLVFPINMQVRLLILSDYSWDHDWILVVVFTY